MAVTRVKTSSLLQGMPKDRSFLAGNEAYDPTEFESIATVSVGSGGSANVEFTSIGTDWTHLQIRGIARTTESAENTICYIQFNSDTTTGNYYGHGIYGTGASAFAYALDGSYYASLSVIPGASATASIFGATVIDILDYRNTNKYKTVRNLSGNDRNGSGQVRFASGLWMSTSAITSIKLVPIANNFAQYSRFALYGIKG